MTRLIWSAAGLGFAMPILWGVFALLLFNVPEGQFSNHFWKADHLFCPFYSLPTVVELPLTAALYAGSALTVTTVLRRIRRATSA